MPEGEGTATPPGGAFDARALWDLLIASGEATLALKKASELALIATGSTMAASSLHLLYEAASALTREFGQQLSALRKSDDPPTRQFVTLLLARLHGAPGPAEHTMKDESDR